MNTISLLNRALGHEHPGAFSRAERTRLLHALQPTTRQYGSPSPSPGSNDAALAHAAGVSSIAIDRFEGRYLLSGGADSSLSMWDLETPSPTTASSPSSPQPHPHQPLSTLRKTSRQHHLGITHLTFYPFDSLAFLSTSYDHTLKLYASDPLAESALFDLGAVVYTHATSAIAPHLLVACGTAGPAVRLVDLKSGAATHSLAGHAGAVLGVAWSPTEEHVLASAGADGGVRFWDIRRSAGCLGVLDAEDSVGVLGTDGVGGGARSRLRGRAHKGAANGVVWTEDGKHVVTTGHDDRVRVWDTATGANTLVSFGPLVKNNHLGTVLPVLAPRAAVPRGRDILFFPNPGEVLAFDMVDGAMLKRLKVPQAPQAPASVRAGVGVGVGGQPARKNRTTALAWRAHDSELFSAHSDGRIRAWAPRTEEEALVDLEEMAEVDEAIESGERKRRAVDEIAAAFTKRAMLGSKP